MDTLDKLTILAEAARFDVACTSSGVNRAPQQGKLGHASAAGCCHSFTPDGRCITLLKVLMSNACSYDCAYCANRRSASVTRASFTPRELAELTCNFYKRNYIEGLFLSSGVIGCADATTERMIECLRILRDELQFNGYIHAKIIPHTSPQLIEDIGHLADRLSVNLELPSKVSLKALCPEKDKNAVLLPMAQIKQGRDNEVRRLKASNNILRSDKSSSTQHASLSFVEHKAQLVKHTHPRIAASKRKFAPAGQSTQLIVGATGENDNHILKLSSSLYKNFDLKRVFFSAYIPILDDPRLPSQDTPVPLRREHRLYQADWLMRYYAFSADELVTPNEPWLDLDLDPKLAWALRNISNFPLEVNEAPLNALLRVPGIGPVGARRIVKARKSKVLGFDDLKRIHITLRRARFFITCSGKRDAGTSLDEELIRRRVVEDAKQSTYNKTRTTIEGTQLTLF